MSALSKSPSKVINPKSPAGPSAATAPRPASPKKALAPGKSAASPPAGSTSPTSGPKKLAPPPGAAKAPPSAALKSSPSGAVSPKSAPGKAPTKAAPAAPTSATTTAAAAPGTSAGKKLFKKAVVPAGTTVPAPAAVTTPPVSTPADAPLAGSSSAHFSDGGDFYKGLSSPIDSSMVVAPPAPGTTVVHAPLDQVIAKNQEAAAALAILVSKQAEQDKEKLDIASGKIDALQKLLMEREAENKSKIDILEKQLGFIVTAHASTKRENDVLKDVLSDRDGPKMVQRLEQLEEENKKLRSESAKFKEMSDYYRNSQLKAMEDVERLREGQPIGPTQTEWELAQDNIGKMAKDNATLTMRLGDLEERLTSLAATKDALAEQQKVQQQQVEASQQQMLSQEHQRAVSEEYQRQQHQGVAPGQQFAARAASSQGILTPQRGGNTYNNLSVPPGFLYQNNSRQNNNTYGRTSASPSPYVNNSKFSGFSGSPVRGNVDQSASNNTPGGSRGWRALMLPNGNVIYHNVISNRSQWEVPNELAQGMTDVVPRFDR